MLVSVRLKSRKQDTMKTYLHAKIHKATITEANKDYIGSVTIDKKLLDLTGIEVGEKVLITNNTNGNRLETYVIAGKDGEICMNGPTSYLMNVGDEVVIMAFEYSNTKPEPKVILVDKENNFIKYLNK